MPVNDDLTWVLNMYGDLVGRQVTFTVTTAIDDELHYGDVISVGLDDAGHPTAFLFDMITYDRVNVAPAQLELVPEDMRKAY